MTLPEPLELLFQWIESHGYFVDTTDGRIGILFPGHKLKPMRTVTGPVDGTDISFMAEGNAYLHHWFGSDDQQIIGRVCVFAKTGGDGSMAALWIADDGSQKIVHLGSGSGSTTLCVLADDPVDFLRLLAIGYDELCWGEAFSEPPSVDGELVVDPNPPYADWVSRTFHTEIPDRASAIVKHPLSMDAPTSPDSFWQWVNSHV